MSSPLAIPCCSSDPAPLMDWTDGPVNSAVLRVVEKHLGHDWKDLGRDLEVEEEKLAQLEMDNRGNIKDAIYQMLLIWKKKNEQEATVNTLVRSLQFIERDDIADKILVLRSQKKTPQACSEQDKDAKPAIGNDISLTLAQLQVNLRNKYKTLVMKGLPWMEDLCLSLENYFVSLEMVKGETNTEHDHEIDEEKATVNKKSRKKLELEEIFSSDCMWRTSLFAEQKSCKILVEGDAGFGKTSLASKLCYDYGNGKSYMKHFDVVLLIPLRNLAVNLEESICKAAFVANNQLDSVFKIINKKSVQTLIILDGFDELAYERFHYILTLISGKVLPRVSLVVTSRTGSLTEASSSASSDILFGMKPKWDSQYKLIGFNEKRQAEFVTRHLNSFTPDEKRRIQLEIKEMKEKKILTANFLKCPLFFLMIFVVLSEENRGLRHVKTMTQLYKHVFNFVIRRYLTKYGIADASKVDLFIFDNDSRPSYVDLMTKLGEMSLSAIQTNQFAFSKETVSVLDPKIYKLGILTQTWFVEGLQEVVRYKPLHKSLIEFAGAYSLLTSFRFGQRDQWKKNILDFRPDVHSFKTSLVLPFLAGLMGNDAGALFDVFQTYADEYSQMFHLLTPTLCEVEITDSVMRSLIPFLPTRWEMYWSKSEISSSSLPPEIMMQGLKIGTIKEIMWDMIHPVCINEIIKVDELVLRLGYETCPLYRSTFAHSLVCRVDMWTNELDCQKLLTFVSSIQFKRISLEFGICASDIFLPFLCKSLMSGALSKIDIYKFQFELRQERSSMLDHLIKLIKNERVESVVIFVPFLPSPQRLRALSDAINTSSRLTAVALKCKGNFSTNVLRQPSQTGNKTYSICNHCTQINPNKKQNKTKTKTRHANSCFS